MSLSMVKGADLDTGRRDVRLPSEVAVVAHEPRVLVARGRGVGVHVGRLDGLFAPSAGSTTKSRCRRRSPPRSPQSSDANSAKCAVPSRAPPPSESMVAESFGTHDWSVDKRRVGLCDLRRLVRVAAGTRHAQRVRIVSVIRRDPVVEARHRVAEGGIGRVEAVTIDDLRIGEHRRSRAVRRVARSDGP